MTMTLEESSTTSAVTLRVRGTVDLATAGDLAARIGDLVEGTGTTIVVDLADVDFLDSTGLGALVSSHNLAVGLGSRLVVAAAPDDVLDLFNLTGLDQVLTIDPAR